MGIQSKVVVRAVMHSNGIMTAFFENWPALVVQGQTEDEIKKKLHVLLQSFIKRLESMNDNFEIKTETIA